MKKNQEGFSMPLGAPAYPGPPYWARPDGISGTTLLGASGWQATFGFLPC